MNNEGKTSEEMILNLNAIKCNKGAIEELLAAGADRGPIPFASFFYSSRATASKAEGGKCNGDIYYGTLHN